MSAQRSSQSSRYFCASLSVSKRIHCSGVRCVCPIPDSTFPFLSEGAVPAGQRDDAVVLEDIAVERVEGRLVDLGLQHARS